MTQMMTGMWKIQLALRRLIRKIATEWVSLIERLLISIKLHPPRITRTQTSAKFQNKKPNNRAKDRLKTRPSTEKLNLKITMT